MEIRLEMKKILPLWMLCLLVETTLVHNVSSSDESRHPRVTGRIVKLYSGIKPDPIICSGEGFQADPVNCAVFYRCIKGSNNKYTVFRYQCGPGTVYDPDIEVCNHPMNTKRANCGGRQFDITASANENEIDSSRQEVPTPISTNKPVYTEQTTKNKDAVTFSTRNPWSTSSNNKIFQSSIISTAYPWVTTTNHKTRVTESPVSRKPSRQVGEQCTSDGFMGDTENCRKFYRCVGNGRGGYIRYEFSCSDLTIWDDEAQACNHAWAVKKRRCGRIHPDNDKNTTPIEENEVNFKRTIQSQLQINYGSKVNQVQTQISNGPVIQNQTQINYGNSSNQKTNSKLKQNQTQISYDSAVSQAQTQINHGNNGFQTQLQVDHTRESSQSQIQINEVNTEQTKVSSQDDETQKPNTEKPINGNGSDECTESGFMGDSKDCKKFYRCVDNGRGSYIKYEFSCGEGTVWDPNAEACNHEWAVKDCNNKVTPGITSQDTKTTSTKSPTQHTTIMDTSTAEDEDVGYGGQNQEQTSTSTTHQDKPFPTTESITKPTPVVTTTSEFTSSTTAVTGTVCTSSGFVGDSTDCKKFYRCVDNSNGGFTKYEYKCGEGTVWDTEIEACNHAWAVKKCGSNSNVASTDKTTTSSSTSLTTVMQTTRPSEEDDDSGYGQPQNEPTLSTTISTTTYKQPELDTDINDCKTSGFMGDDRDCKKFYRCVDNRNGAYTRYEFSCGEGTVWDPKIEACNHAWAVEKCGKGTHDQNTSETTTQIGTSTHDENNNVYPTNSATSEQVQSTTTIMSSTISSSTSTSSTNICMSSGFMGDSNDCKKFYRCVEDGRGGLIRYDFTCGEGTMWDSEINACNHIKSVKNDCSSPANNFETTQKQPVHENDEVAESSTSEITAALTTTESSKEKPSTSNNKCESEGFFANAEDCKKFYRCVDDGKGSYTKYDFSCGDGTIWDEQAQTCNHESSQVKCSQTSGTSSSEKPHSNSEATTQNELATESTTPKKPPIDSTTSSNKDECSSEGFYANSNNCKKFYRCVDNGKGSYTKYDFSCGEGTVWVQEIQACDHDNDITNCSSQIASSTSTYQDEQHSSTDSSTSAQSSTTEISQSDSSTSLNECTTEGFYANKNDCKKFYRCVDNGKGGFTSYDFKCGDGTAWDSEIQACNYIDQVKDCQGSQHQNQSESSTVDPSKTTEATSTAKTSTTESSGENKQPLGTDKCEKEGYFGDSNNCQKFYRCVDNGKGDLTKYDYTCGEGTIWDQDILACNHPRDVQNPSCNNNSSETTTESSNDASSSTSGSSTTSSKPSSSSSSTEGQSSSECSQSSTQKPQNKNVNCTKAGFYADPDDCKKFYRCVDWDNNGKRFSVYHFDCGEGTIWDPELETCNHENSVYPPRDCSGTPTHGQNTTDESTTTTTTDKSTTSEYTTQESTTTEESTTETSTISEQTEQTTKSTTESTTTQQSTTTESTTINEQTTTEQSSTTEQSTTQKSTTTEKSTTQQSSTTQQATTQQSSTTEESTTEQTSTTEQSTTQQGSTTEESTTQQSSSTEQSTTESEQTTTQQSSTTQEETTTTEQSTTEQTTESSTDESSTPEETTTQESSTTEQTTDATESSTTEQSGSTTTEQNSDSTTTESNPESTTESSSDSKECPETDDDQNVYVCPTSFRRHPKYCNMFYQCTEEDDSHDLHIAVFKCPNNTIYDESKTQCVDKDKADKKCEGEIEERKRVKRLNTNFKDPIIVSKEPLVCPGTGHYPFEKSECSPAFLKCDKTKSGHLRGYVHRCPEGYVYWSISRRCETKASVRDCKLTANDWRGRWEIPTERKNVAT